MGVVSGSPPYFMRDITAGEWTGAAVAMAKSIADVWSAGVIFVETTFGNSVLDVQSNKIEIALNPTPQRALAIGFTRPDLVARGNEVQITRRRRSSRWRMLGCWVNCTSAPTRWRS